MVSEGEAKDDDWRLRDDQSSCPTQTDHNNTLDLSQFRDLSSPRCIVELLCNICWPVGARGQMSSPLRRLQRGGRLDVRIEVKSTTSTISDQSTARVVMKEGVVMLGWILIISMMIPPFGYELPHTSNALRTVWFLIQLHGQELCNMTQSTSLVFTSPTQIVWLPVITQHQ